MNLVKGKIIRLPGERDAVLDTLDAAIYNTLKRDVLDVDLVINACDTLSKAIGQEHVDLLVSAGIPARKAKDYLREAKSQLSRENLIKRLRAELGTECFSEITRVSDENSNSCIKERIMPWGTLLHIAAGNQLGLAFYSVIEGLLTGNINIVKLPSGDNGLSAMIFLELLKIEPQLKDYIYLFDYTSKETEALQKLMTVAEAIVVWGGDEAVQAVRNVAGPSTKIIEWGHKLSFAYATPKGYNEQTLYGLAENIVETNQLLCSSCQGIFLDTDSMEDVYRFCETFLPVLDRCRLDYDEDIPLEIQAQTGLMVYTESLQASCRPCKVYRGECSSLLAYEDSLLETAIPYGNCWVKRLPRQTLIRALRPHKSHLQTAGLLCDEEEKQQLTELLWKAGVTRVTQGKNMSRTYIGAAHDGEYGLRRYTRVVSQEFLDCQERKQTT